MLQARLSLGDVLADVQMQSTRQAVGLYSGAL